VILGLDVTERSPILPEHVARLAELAGDRPDEALARVRGTAAAAGRSPGDGTDGSGSHGSGPPGSGPPGSTNLLVGFIADALRFYMEFHAKWDGFYGAHIHDPMVVAAALDRSLVRTRAVFVDVETGSGPAGAMTVADFRGLTGRPPNAEVAIEVDGAVFLDRWLERVSALAARRFAPGG
jgi:inosine-uridine nucleoside N-ribohydrolase